MSRPRRAAAVVLLTVAVVVGATAAAWADPAKPSNYDSRIVEAPSGVDVEVRGGDSFIVVEVPTGTEVLVPGYDDDEDFSDWEQLEQYLRVLPDGTVQLNRNAAAYYQNQARYGASPEGVVGPDVPPDWETVGADGRVAFHDHRIHWMSPVLPPSVDPDGPTQRVTEYTVPVVVDGGLELAAGELDFVPDPSPVPVLGAALLGLLGGVVLARRDLRLGAVAALVTGGTVAGLLVASTVGRAPGFDVGTPPVALALVGAVAPLLGTTVGSVREGQRRGLVALGGGALLAFGLLATGLLDPLVGGGPVEEGGFGNWWFRPTLPIDLAPEVLRLALAAATGIGAALVAAVAGESLAVPGGLDGLDRPDGEAADTATGTSGGPATTDT